MDYKDYTQQNKNEVYLWHRARKRLIFFLLENAFKNYAAERKILNVGCGTGTEMEELKKFGKIVGMDIEQKAVELAKKNGFNAVLGDIEKEDLEKNHYDCICCFDILEHLYKDIEVINKIHSALKPGGYFFFTVPAYKFLFGPHDKALNHFRRYNRKKLREILSKQNFSILKLGYWNSIIFPAIVVFRILKIFYFKIFKVKEHKPETFRLNKFLASFFFHVLLFESKLASKNLSLPFGLSIYGVCRKK